MAPKTPQNATLRQEQAAETRRNLLDSAKRLFAANGYSLTPVRSINRALDMSDGILYHYFPGGKKEILSVILCEGIDKSLAMMRSLNEELESIPLTEALDRIYKQADLLFTDDLDLVKIILKEGDNLELEEGRVLSEAIQERIAWFAGFLERRHKKGEIRAMNFAAAARQFLAIGINNAVAKLLKFDLLGSLAVTENRREIIDHTLALWRNP